MDFLKTKLSYNVQLASHGDDACNNVAAVVSLADDSGSTFTHVLTDSDIDQAHSDGGLNYTIQSRSSNAGLAYFNFMDSNAFANASANATGWVTPNDVDCSVNVHDFCLTDAWDKGDGLWGFNFTIRAASNSQCGSVSATLDLIYNEADYLASVVVPNDEIVSSFDCDCDRAFTVTAEFSGNEGDVFGQLDVRNPAHDIITMVDSGVFHIA